AAPHPPSHPIHILYTHITYKEKERKKARQPPSTPTHHSRSEVLSFRLLPPEHRNPGGFCCLGRLGLLLHFLRLLSSEHRDSRRLRRLSRLHFLNLLHP